MSNSLPARPRLTFRSLVAGILAAQMLLPAGLLAQMSGQTAPQMGANSTSDPAKASAIRPSQHHR